MYLLTMLVAIFAYLLGSISSAIGICKLMHLPDPRQFGSGNPGATNVLRLGGKKAAILTLVGDVLKGTLPVLLAKMLHLSLLAQTLVALAAFFGHLFPLFFQFKGGKGVATAFGGLLALSFPFSLLLLGTWLLTALMFRYSSLAALVTAILAPCYAAFWFNLNVSLVIGVMSLALLVRHKKNIMNLYKGEESKIGKKTISPADSSEG